MGKWWAIRGERGSRTVRIGPGCGGTTPAAPGAWLDPGRGRRRTASTGGQAGRTGPRGRPAGRQQVGAGRPPATSTLREAAQRPVRGVSPRTRVDRLGHKVPPQSLPRCSIIGRRGAPQVPHGRGRDVRARQRRGGAGRPPGWLGLEAIGTASSEGGGRPGCAIEQGFSVFGVERNPAWGSGRCRPSSPCEQRPRQAGRLGSAVPSSSCGGLGCDEVGPAGRGTGFCRACNCHGSRWR